MRRFGAIVSLLLLIAFGYFGCKHMFSGWESSSTDAHSDARRAFDAALPESECLSADEIRDVAEEWGWAVRDEEGFGWCVAPAGVSAWLRVTVEPPLPFSTDDENAAFYAFDAEGCSIPWRYASGEGTTCPN
ncbi:hypothetical protein [Lentibacter sp. XHP0401]|uniref:hypothetical protein n=1 Tax=Lentibacter sp. XHP0401 TaxID=2984334 RepID=UPI0021E74CAC|nr:hypothetical protein [Lentibacter sp. XHP0401]MCV2893229.1 hypothetical protein [Lentibacter sp. XHP0401]